MKRMTDKQRMDKALAIKEITEPNDIFLLLDRIHMRGVSNDEPIKKLFCLLLGQDEWNYGHSMEFYGAILNQYSVNEELEMLCAISGVSEPYKKLSKPSERRKLYLIHLSEKCSDSETDEVIEKGTMEERTMEEREKTALKHIAERLYTNFLDNEMFSLCKKWMAEIGLNPDDLNELEKTSKSEVLSTRKRQKQNKKNTGSNIKGREKKTGKLLLYIRMLINILNAKSKYCLGALIVIVLLLIAMFVISISYVSSIRQHNTLLADLNSKLKKPTIEQISIMNNPLTLKPGEEGDPGIRITPAEAGKDHLDCAIKNKNIAVVTHDWKVMGGYGWKEGSDNSTDINIWGDDAPSVKIKVKLVPGYIDSARDGEYENQTNDGKFIDNNKAD